MKKEDLRQVTVDKNKMPGYMGSEVFVGRFHKWGSKAISTNDGDVIPHTYGIVEHESTGAIHQVTPECITFLDK